MLDLLYIRNNNFEHTCIRLFNFLKNNKWDQNIYIVLDHDMDSEQRTFIKKIYNVEFVTPLKFAMLHSRSRHVQEIAMQSITPDHNLSEHTCNNTHAIFLYVYYTEFINEICSSINTFVEHTPCDLHVSICENCVTEEQNLTFYKNQFHNNIKSNIPIYIYGTRNCGRDVLPFLNFIQNKHYKPYKYICKIHTKKTTYLSPSWRQDYMKILLGSQTCKGLVETVKPSISSVKQFSITESFTTGNSNYNGINKVASMVNVQIPKNYKFTYNAGTMFWCNNEYCNTIYNLLKDVDMSTIFEPEPIPSDGSIAHAWERFFFII